MLRIGESSKATPRILQELRALDFSLREAAMVAKEQNATVQEKNVEKLLVAGIRAKGVFADSKQRFGQLARAVGSQISGTPLGLYYDAEYKDQDADFESCFPIRKPVQKEGILVHEIEGGRCVSTLHVGPYGEIRKSYQRVFEYIRERKLTPKIPSREVYIKGPGMIFKGNPNEYVTEIQVLVEG